METAINNLPVPYFGKPLSLTLSQGEGTVHCLFELVNLNFKLSADKEQEIHLIIFNLNIYKAPN